MLFSLLLCQKPDIQDSVCCKTQLYQIEKCRPTKEPCEVSEPEAEPRTSEEVWIFILWGRVEREPITVGHRSGERQMVCSGAAVTQPPNCGPQPVATH